ncbi:MAG: hypothetical protein PHT69_15620 [Bacteroidales bacterium]|nr:hypothetical protein [Bacteroidales bacterium]
MKKILYILSLILIVFFTYTSFFIIKKENQYKPRTLLLQDLSNNNLISSQIQKRLIDYNFLNKKFKLYEKEYEIIVQYTIDDFHVWLKFTRENSTNLQSIYEDYGTPNNCSNFEKIQNYFKPLYVCGFNYSITPPIIPANCLKIINNCQFNSVYCKPETPPPQICFLQEFNV